MPFVEWYTTHAFQMLAGGCLFFFCITWWVWMTQGKDHLFSEIGVYVAGFVVFVLAATEPPRPSQWAWALLSLAMWAHILGIVRSIVFPEKEKR
jgi:hypothetical protein